MAEQQRGFVLPVSIISPTDIARLKRELEQVEGYFQQVKIREGGQQQAVMPRLSKLMDQLAVENKLNLLLDEHRSYVLKSLEVLQSTAPVLHISFSVDPPGSYVQKIVYWMRSNIHAQVLVTVGLQPNIGAGCIVRTTNRIFDFSLREYFNAKRDFFIEKMHEAIADQAVVTASNSDASTNQAVTNVADSQSASDTAPGATEAVAPATAQIPQQPATTLESVSTPEASPAAQPILESAQQSQTTKIAVNVVETSGGSQQ